MGKKIPKKFMRNSKQMVHDNPEFKDLLDKVMGRVADGVVRRKYVDKTEDEDDSKPVHESEDDSASA